MQKILTYLLLLFLSLNTQAFAYTDKKTSAQNYNRQGELALKHAQDLKNPESLRRMYYKEAKYFFTKSTNIYANNFEGFLGLAKANMYLGISKKAYDNFMIAYNFNQDNVVINYYLGEFNFLNEKINDALYYYLRATDLGYANHYNTNYQIALCYDKLGDSKLALKYYRKCLQINPEAKNPQQKILELETQKAKYNDYYK